MTENHSQRVVFRFDDSKNFDVNCDAFFEAIKADDSEMAAILCGSRDALVAIVKEGERDSKARGDFNSKVARALDALVSDSAEPNGGA